MYRKRSIMRDMARVCRHRITIQEQKTIRDEFGQPTQGWFDVMTVWASVEAVSGREYWAAQQVVDQSDHRVTIRYRPGITPTMRVLHDGRQLDIQAVLDRTGEKRWLELMCKEVGIWQRE